MHDAMYDEMIQTIASGDPIAIMNKLMDFKFSISHFCF